MLAWQAQMEENEDDSSVPETLEAMFAKGIKTFKLMKKEPASTCASDKEVLKMMG